MKRIACSGESVMDRDDYSKYETVIFDSSKYDVDSERYDAITSYPILKMESRRIFYCKIFNMMKSSYRY
jgi:hypothetical protein